MADKGDVHFLITAENMAEEVLAKFNDTLSKDMNKAVGEITSAMDPLGKKLAFASDTLGAFWDLAKNPTPLGLLGAGVKIASSAWTAFSEEGEKALNTLEEFQRLGAASGAGANEIARMNLRAAFSGKPSIDKAEAEFRASNPLDVSGLDSRQAALARQEYEKQVAEFRQAFSRDFWADFRQEGKSAFKDAFGSIEKTTADAMFGADTARMNEVQKKMAEFDRSFLNTDVSKMNSDERNKLNEAYVVERKRYEAALLKEQSIKRQLEAEQAFMDLNKQFDDADRKRQFDKQQEFFKQGAQARKDARNPRQVFDDKVKDLMALEMFGAIDKGAMNQGIEKARKERDDALKKDSPNKQENGTNLVESRFLTRGSGNMDPQYKIAENTDRMAKAAERQAELMEEEKRNRNNNVGAQIAVGVF